MAAAEAPSAAALKEQGNLKFKAGEFEAAVEAYSRSLELDPAQHLCYSNRSAAYLKLGTATPGNYNDLALEDANKCVEIAPAWAKGYSRKAASLQALKRWEEAAETCEVGLKACGSDDALKKMLLEVRNRQFQDSLKGIWHGTVSQDLGGYDQEMEFLDDTGVRVEVVGRSIVGRYWVDCSVSPHKLDIQVPLQDAPPGMPPPPPVPYIARLDSDGLHICCPHLKLDRPTTFEGPGYCMMKRGAVAATDNSEIEKLSKDEKLKRCAQELINVLPDRQLEEVLQTDSEDVVRDKMMAQVKFESSMYTIHKQYTEQVMKEVLDATKPNAKNVPEVLKNSPELEALKEKLRKCGMFDDAPAQATAQAPAQEPSQGAAAPPQPVPPEPSKDAGSSSSEGPSSGLLYGVAGVSVALALAAITYTAWKRRKN